MCQRLCRENLEVQMELNLGSQAGIREWGSLLYLSQKRWERGRVKGEPCPLYQAELLSGGVKGPEP